MRFDIKDVKSWANRKDVKIGEKGYFINDLESFKEDCADNSEFKIDCIKGIRDDFANCFISNTLFCLQDCFPFFLPLKTVKADEPKKYRPFKDLYEFYKFLSFGCFFAREDFTQNMLLGMKLTYRDKKALRIASTIVINRIDVDLKKFCEPLIEGRNLELWFDLAEIMNSKGEWQPFGIEVKEND